MIYVNENRVTGEKTVVKKEREENLMKTNKPTAENKKNDKNDKHHDRNQLISADNRNR